VSGASPKSLAVWSTSPSLPRRVEITWCTYNRVLSVELLERSPRQLERLLD
jgi:hypothetical protein